MVADKFQSRYFWSNLEKYLKHGLHPITMD